MERIAELLTNVTPYRNHLLSSTNGIQEEPLQLTCTHPENEHDNHVAENGSDFGKTLSIRCIVEFVPNGQYLNGSHSTNVPNGYARTEVDRQVKIPVHTEFYKVVDVVLQEFGYPKEAAATAKGSIEIENWKPITVEKVALNHQKTVDEILGEIRRIVTLRIRILKTSNNYDMRYARIKEQLLQWFVLQCGERMQHSGCPLNHLTFGCILRGTMCPTEEEILKFDQWMTNQLQNPLRPNVPSSRFLSQCPSNLPSPTASNTYHDDRVNPALQIIHKPQATHKQRTRTSFDQELEIPLLQRWFSENQNPTPEQKQEYVNKLNSLESRRGKKKLAVHNVTYWFKNTRAALKKDKSRKINSSRMNSPNGYESNSHSPCDFTGASRESVGSYDEDDTNDEGNRSNKMEEDEKEDNSDRKPFSPSVQKHENENSVKNSPSGPEEIKLELSGDNRRQIVATAAGSSSEPLSSSDQLEYDSETDTINGYGSDDDDEQPDKNGYSEIESNSKYYNNSSSLWSKISVPGSNTTSPLDSNTHNFLANPWTFPWFLRNGDLNAAAATNLVETTPTSRSSIWGGGGGGVNLATYSSSEDQKRAAKRNRTFIDPTTEVPRLEEWFRKVTHPSTSQVLQFTDTLNSMRYRQKFPKLEQKSVKFWFKNRRAKDKRLNVYRCTIR